MKRAGWAFVIGNGVLLFLYGVHVVLSMLPDVAVWVFLYLLFLFAVYVAVGGR